MANFKTLALEVNHILTASHPVHLAELHGIISKIDSDQLTLWSNTNSCQVAPLAAYVLHCSKWEPLAVSLLFRLLRDSAPVRGALARTQHGALSAFLDTADDLLSISDVETLHIALLGANLPSRFSHARGAISSVQALFENRSAQTLDRWLLNVRTVLPSVPIQVLSSVSPEAFHILLIGWNEAITSSQDQTALAALSLSHVTLALSTETGCCNDRNEVGQDKTLQWTTILQKISGVYREDRVSGVIKLLARFVLGVCVLVPPPGVLSPAEIVDLAFACAHPLAEIALTHVFSSNAPWLRKMVSKVESEAMSIELRLAVLRFVLAIDTQLKELRFSVLYSIVQQGFKALNNGLPVSVEATIANQLSNLIKELPHVGQVKGRTVVESASEQELSRNVSQVNQAAATALSKLLISEVLHMTFQSCTPSQKPSAEATMKLKNCEVLLDTLRWQMMQECGIFKVEDLVEKINDIGIPQWWLQTVTIAEEAKSCTEEEVCARGLENLRQSLCRNTSDLIIWNACLCTEKLRRTDLSRVQQQIRNSHVVDMLCHYQVFGLSTSRTTTGLQPPLYSTNGGENNLETGLPELEITVKSKIEGMIYNHCRDLQQRCENVEEPLRALDEELCHVKLELSVTKEQLVSLEHANCTLIANHRATLASRDIEFHSAQALASKTLNARHEQIDELTEALRESEKLRQECEDEYEELENGHSKLRKLNKVIQQSLVEVSEEATRANDHCNSIERQAIQKSAEYEDEIKTLNAIVQDLEQENLSHSSEIRCLQDQVHKHTNATVEQSRVMEELQELARSKEEVIISLKRSMEEAEVERKAAVKAMDLEHASKIDELQYHFERTTRAKGEEHEKELRELKEGRDSERRESEAETSRLAQEVSDKEAAIAGFEASLLKSTRQIKEYTDVLTIAEKQIMVEREAFQVREKMLLGQLEKAKKTQTSVLAMLQARAISEDDETEVEEEPRQGE